MVVSLAQTIESEFASALSNTIIGIIDGTQTAEEAFANMFKNIGKAFIDMATQMIAKLLIIKALQAITGMIGGGGGAATMSNGTTFDWTSPDPGIIDAWGGIPKGYANGGVIPPNSLGLVGERGPELISTGSQPINVTSNEQSQAAMARYSPANSATANVPMAPIKFESTVINNQEFVTREQAEAIGQQAARDGAIEGAKRGEAMTLSRLQQPFKPSKAWDVRWTPNR